MMKDMKVIIDDVDNDKKDIIEKKECKIVDDLGPDTTSKK